MDDAVDTSALLPDSGPRKDLGRSLVEAVLILLVAGILAFAYRAVGDAEGIDDSGVYVSIEESQAFLNSLWVDARTLAEYETEHVAGSLLLNEEDWEELLFPLLERWDPDQTIFVYCSRSACLRSLHVAKRLRAELGVEDVYAIEGGWTSIVESDLLIE